MGPSNGAAGGDGGTMQAAGVAGAAALPSIAAEPSAAAEGRTLVELALEVLHEGDPFKKAALTARAAELWRSGSIAAATPPTAAARAAAAARVPTRPARADSTVRVVSFTDAPKKRSVQATLHHLAHVENWAVDLGWDVVARWGSDEALWVEGSCVLPREFFDDFVAVAEDEARHFTLLEARLREGGSYYGALPVHDTLWDAAAATAHSLPARLAIEHACHEARGLDVLPNTIKKFRTAGDEGTAVLLETVVYPEEVSHCAAGVRWLKHLHAAARRVAAAGQGHTQQQQQQQQEGEEKGGLTDSEQQQQQQQQQQHETAATRESLHAHAANLLPSWAEEALQHETPVDWFHSLVRRYYGPLKGPFNTEARSKAGFTEEWYMPLVGAGGGPGGHGSGGAAAAVGPAAIWTANKGAAVAAVAGAVATL